jgi:hypothetical protein
VEQPELFRMKASQGDLSRTVEYYVHGFSAGPSILITQNYHVVNDTKVPNTPLMWWNSSPETRGCNAVQAICFLETFKDAFDRAVAWAPVKSQIRHVVGNYAVKENFGSLGGYRSFPAPGMNSPVSAVTISQYLCTNGNWSSGIRWIGAGSVSRDQDSLCVAKGFLWQLGRAVADFIEWKRGSEDFFHKHAGACSLAP